MSEHQPEQRGGPPAADTEHVEGHDVFVTRDETGVTSMSEHAAGADPEIVADEDVGEADDEGPDREAT